MDVHKCAYYIAETAGEIIVSSDRTDPLVKCDSAFSFMICHPRDEICRDIIFNLLIEDSYSFLGEFFHIQKGCLPNQIFISPKDRYVKTICFRKVIVCPADYL